MLPRPLVGLAFVLSSFIQSVSAAEISYSRDVQPIFTAKCVACHACYDSPCQLNLSSAEGAQRGANQLPVYDGTRTKAQETTRLYLDAHGADAWRRKDFWSVLEPQDGQAALMARMLELGHSQPLQPNAKIPEGLDISINRANQCPTPASIDAFIRKNPGSGMPFAVAGLSDDEYATLQKWLAAGWMSSGFASDTARIAVLSVSLTVSCWPLRAFSCRWSSAACWMVPRSGCSMPAGGCAAKLAALARSRPKSSAGEALSRSIGRSSVGLSLDGRPAGGTRR